MLLLTRDGRLTTAYSVTGKSICENLSDLLRLWADNLAIESRTPLKVVFQIVAKATDDSGILQTMLNRDLDVILSQAAETPTAQWDALDEIVVANLLEPSVKILPKSPYYVFVPPFTIRRVCYGLKDGNRIDLTALDFDSYSELLHLPVRYDPALRFYDMQHPFDRKLLFQSSIAITLGEFLSAILREIGLYDQPEERARNKPSPRLLAAADRYIKLHEST